MQPGAAAADRLAPSRDRRVKRASIDSAAGSARMTGTMKSRAFACLMLAVCVEPSTGCRQTAQSTGIAQQSQPSAKTEREGSYVVVNGHRLWYLVAGHGPPLLLIPGGPGSPHDYFTSSFARLEDSFEVVYFDAFGRGKSDRAANPAEYSLNHDVEDIEGLRLALHLSTIAVYGHSYGGIVAQAYALKYPKSLSQLILADTIHSSEMWQKGNNDNSNQQIENQFPEVWSELQVLRRKGRLSCDPDYQALEGRVPPSLFLFYNAARAFPLDVNVDVYCQIAGRDADVTLGGDLASFDFRRLLRDIQTPSLILAGRFDRVSLPRYAVQYRTLMPQAEFVIFEQSGHMPFVEEPERHDSVLRTFLTRTRRPAP